MTTPLVPRDILIYVLYSVLSQTDRQVYRAKLISTEMSPSTLENRLLPPLSFSLARVFICLCAALSFSLNTKTCCTYATFAIMYQGESDYFV